MLRGNWANPTCCLSNIDVADADVTEHIGGEK